MLVAAASSRSQTPKPNGESGGDDLFSTLSSWSSSLQKTFHQVLLTPTNSTTSDFDSNSNPSSSSTTSSSSTNSNNHINNNSGNHPSSSSSALSTVVSSSSPTNPNHHKKQMLKEKRPLMRNQIDFSSGEDEESMIGSASSSLKKISGSESIGDWFSSVQNSITKQWNEWSSASSNNNNNIGQNLDNDDGPLAKVTHSSRSKSPSTSSPNVTSNNNNGFMDSLSSTFASIKTQTNDKWTLLRDQFFDNNSQNAIDENDNSFLGRLSKEIDGMITLTAKQRMYGFFMSLGFGLLCIIIALGFLPSILFASGAFAFFYTFGNLLCLVSTFFLVGPVAQVKNMAKPDRAIPSALFIASMVLTLICVFAMPIALLIILLVIMQAIGLVWYVISYIPFAQQILGMIFSSFMRVFN
ncbi:hypothetical protein FDP41_010805 [Naegleria fowleri]|uniref:Vesicle transport protein n=1 Tax=Naegleria fowleri TaxID=5763 RepID=A0A6A5C4Z9_NAEFO|nr:uncharacterized protein FDP41_010805 [Naegleria fowleri]KAF0982826.1 hypothetical protein FDP41_010805 [Naegleria fowleri]CAG4707749.1 unnamed protein product [Naegleria fowleri]